MELSPRAKIILWQLLFILLGTTWLLAPHLNHALSYRSSLISQYEAPLQPFSWLFRAGDILAGTLVVLMSINFLKLKKPKIVGYLLLVIGLGFILDPLLPTTCRNIGNTCQEYFSPSFLLHAIETVITGAAILSISAYDWWLRRRLVSAFFVIFQLAYEVLFLTQLANQNHFNTASQYVYQTILIVWIAWFYRSFMFSGQLRTSKTEAKIVKNIVAGWAFLNGFLAILVSLADINVLGRIKGVYFAGDSAWLAEHGVVVGVIMIYLSRHLARGEMRARQIFLVITGIETLKYSVVSPNVWLMVLYLLTFCALFVLSDNFDRGTVVTTLRVRLKDALFMIGSLLAVMLIALTILSRTNELSDITAQSVDHFFDYTLKSEVVKKTHVKSALLAHTEAAFALAGISTIAWILFRPYKSKATPRHDSGKVEELLRKYSLSSEDYFKLWPNDKKYHFNKKGTGFVAYREIGSISFALEDPIAPASNRKGLINEFVASNKARRIRTCFLLTGSKSLRLYKDSGLETLQIGASALINTENFLNDTANDKWWRWKKNRALKSGYAYVTSTPPHSDVFLRQLKAVSNEWLKIGGHEERGFALGYFDEKYLQECVVHYLNDKQGKVVAFTNQLPQFKPLKTATVDLLRYLPEAHDAMPYLLFKTIEQAKHEGFTDFDLGFVPFAKAEGPVLAIARALSTSRFSSKGLEQFKNKFKPNWHPNYMAYDGDLADLALIALNLERAMKIEPKE
jgi:lysylphosphatidylglycerol synthetase-like protein (DUF2156 family)